MKNFLLKCGSRRYFSGSLAVFTKEDGEPLNFLGFAAAPSEARGEGEANSLWWTLPDLNW